MGKDGLIKVIWHDDSQVTALFVRKCIRIIQEQR